TVQRVVDRFRSTATVDKSKSSGCTTVLTEDVLEDVRTRMEQRPKKLKLFVPAQDFKDVDLQGKDTIYRILLHTTENLENVITKTYHILTQQQLRNVSDNMKRSRACLHNYGGHKKHTM
ncbi:hypothetical protein ILUMI_18859, partial [Ignelater luminosus]